MTGVAPNPLKFNYDNTAPAKDILVSSFYTFYDEPECGTVDCKLGDTNGASCDTSSFGTPESN